MIQLIRFMCAFVALNYFSGKGNIKHMVHQAMDVSLVIRKVSKDGIISKEDKDAVVQELAELSEAVIKFLDEIELPY